MENLIPQEAEHFLARLEEMPPLAWEEVTQPYRRLGLGDLLKGFWQQIRARSERRAVRQLLGDDLQSAISERLLSLRESGVIPASFAALAVTSGALGALCAREIMTPAQFGDAYGRFEDWIPAASLKESVAPPDV